MTVPHSASTPASVFAEAIRVHPLVNSEIARHGVLQRFVCLASPRSLPNTALTPPRSTRPVDWRSTEIDSPRSSRRASGDRLLLVRVGIVDESACDAAQDPVRDGGQRREELPELASREREHADVGDGCDRGGAPPRGRQERDLTDERTTSVRLVMSRRRPPRHIRPGGRSTRGRVPRCDRARVRPRCREWLRAGRSSGARVGCSRGEARSRPAERCAWEVSS